MLHRRFLLSLVVALSLSTLAFANSATVNLTFLYPGANVSGGYYTYPFYFSITGGKATPMMCDSFNHHITAGENWNANVSGLLSRNGLFGKDIRDDKAAGIIFMGVVNGTIDAKVGNRAEPGSLMLLSTGLIGIAGMLRRNLVRA